jgi:hypothetical protein
MPKKKKKTVRPSKKNPIDPNLIARAVLEAAIGEPLTGKKKSPSNAKE